MLGGGFIRENRTGHLDRGVRERLFAVLGEHGRHDVRDYVQFREVGCCQVNEDVARVQCDLAMLRVDDWRHGQNTILRIVYDGVYR
jgi:hypothetical protein